MSTTEIDAWCQTLPAEGSRAIKEEIQQLQDIASAYRQERDRWQRAARCLWREVTEGS